MHGSLLPEPADPVAGAPGGERYRSVQVARALAVLGVVIVHSQTVAARVDGGPYRHGLWSFGQAGVDLFFVISGFIIAMVVDRPQSAARFTGRRAARILPFYWLFTIAVIPLAMLETTPVPAPESFAASLLLVPQGDVPVLGVGWSLEHEVIFYAIAAVLLAVRRACWLFPVMAIVAGASVAAHLIAPDQVRDGRDLHLLSLYHLQFLTGMALYRYRRVVARWRSPSMLLTGILLFPATGAVLQLLHQSIVPAQPAGWIGILRVILWGLASTCVLGGLLAWEHGRPGAYRSAPALPLLAIGDASYTLYLSHPIALGVVGHGLPAIWPAGWPSLAAQAIAAGVAIGVALLFHRACERPLLERLRV